MARARLTEVPGRRGGRSAPALTIAPTTPVSGGATSAFSGGARATGSGAGLGSPDGDRYRRCAARRPDLAGSADGNASCSAGPWTCRSGSSRCRPAGCALPEGSPRRRRAGQRQAARAERPRWCRRFPADRRCPPLIASHSGARGWSDIGTLTGLATMEKRPCESRIACTDGLFVLGSDTGCGVPRSTRHPIPMAGRRVSPGRPKDAGDEA